MRIMLTNGFYIDTDERNYILMQRRTSKGKDGKPKEVDKLCGYFGRNDITAVLRRYLKLNQNVLLDDETMEIEEYIKSIERINNDALKALQSVYEDDGK